MKKKILSAIVITILAFSALIGCQADDSNDSDKNSAGDNSSLKISTSNTPYSIPMFYLVENNILDDEFDLEVEIHKSGQEAVAKAMNQDVDLITFGVQEVAKLHNREVPVRLIDVSVWGDFKIMSSREDITKISDLKGQDVWLGSKGGTMDLVANLILSENGIDIAKDISVNRMQSRELTQMVIGDVRDIDIFVTREPFASQIMNERDSIKPIFDLSEEYQDIYGQKLPQSGTAIVSESLMDNSERLKFFESEYGKAIDWVKENPEEAAEIGHKYLDGFSVEILEQSIENMDMNLVSIEDARTSLESYYEKILDFNPDILGDKLPNESFYKGI